MQIGGYKIRNQAAAHFLTFTVVDWVDVFTRQAYRDILINSIRHCQQERGLQLNCWCVMSNHVHLIASAKEHDLSAIIRDLKKFTSNSLIKAIAANPSESRREWMIRLFAEKGQQNSRNKNYQFWQQDNHPEECYSNSFTFQKINYIHQNPVEAGIVLNPWEYLYSSARDYYAGRKCGMLDVVF